MPTTALPSHPGAVIPRMSWGDSLSVAPQVLRFGINGYIQSALALKGEVVEASLGPLPAVFVSHPQLVRQVLITNKDNYVKDNPLFAYLRPLAGNGLFLSDGEFWRSQRRIMQPEFTRKGVDALVNEMTSVAEAVASEWDSSRSTGDAVDVTESMREAAMRIICRTVLDTDVAGKDAARLSDALDRFLLLFQVQLSVPSPLAGLASQAVDGPLRRCLASIDDFISGVVANSRERKTDGVVNRLLAAPDPETGRSMSVAHLRDEIVTLFIAGHETTANTLAWAWLELCRHPHLIRRLQDEVNAIGQGPLRAADLSRLPFTRAVFDETLRLYPPVPFVPRKALADDELGGHQLRAGTLVLASVFGLQRRAELWPDPLRFDPERFMPERRQGIDPSTYAPFGAGPRTCLGNHFAVAEGQVLLATLARRFDLELATRDGIEITRFPGSLRPGRPVRVRLSARRS